MEKLTDETFWFLRFPSWSRQQSQWSAWFIYGTIHNPRKQGSSIEYFHCFRIIAIITSAIFLRGPGRGTWPKPSMIFTKYSLFTDSLTHSLHTATNAVDIKSSIGWPSVPQSRILHCSEMWANWLFSLKWCTSRESMRSTWSTLQTRVDAGRLGYAMMRREVVCQSSFSRTPELCLRLNTTMKY